MTHVGSGEAAGRAAWLVLAAVVASAQPPPGGMSPAPFVLMEGRGAFERQTVCGAPYSARTETELVQKLADGNRISRRWTGSVARDGEGRVRREHPIAAIGMLMAPADAPRIVVITDPVQRVTWFLEAGTRTARRMAWSAEARPTARVSRRSAAAVPSATSRRWRLRRRPSRWARVRSRACAPREHARPTSSRRARSATSVPSRSSASAGSRPSWKSCSRPARPIHGWAKRCSGRPRS
jgi:hypothetical protein